LRRRALSPPMPQAGENPPALSGSYRFRFGQMGSGTGQGKGHVGDVIARESERWGRPRAAGRSAGREVYEAEIAVEELTRHDVGGPGIAMAGGERSAGNTTPPTPSTRGCDGKARDGQHRDKKYLARNLNVMPPIRSRRLGRFAMPLGASRYGACARRHTPKQGRRCIC